MHANPSWIAYAYLGFGRAFTETDPARALDTLRVGLAYTREHPLPLWEAVIARDTAGLEADPPRLKAGCSGLVRSLSLPSA